MHTLLKTLEYNADCTQNKSFYFYKSSLEELVRTTTSLPLATEAIGRHRLSKKYCSLIN